MFKRSLLIAALLASCVFASAQKTYMAFLGPYSVGTSYAKNEIVLVGTTYYISLVPGNVNHLPSNSPLQWAVFGSQSGSIGPAGESAYQLAVDNGFVGTVQQWIASLSGAPGVNGTNGTNGTNGSNGVNGTNGVNGSTWYQGATSPAAGLGANGDYYFNTATSDVSQKASGAWSVISNLKGRGFNYRGSWAASTAYAPYDVVSYNGQTYEASISFSSGVSFDPSNWNLWASSASVTPCSANGFNGKFYTSCYSGLDVGAMITAADTAAGSGNADIYVTRDTASTLLCGGQTPARCINSAFHLSANHRLFVDAPVTVSSNGMGWNISANSAVFGRGAAALFTLATGATGPLMLATSVGGIEVGNIWTNWTTILGGDGGNVLFSGANVNNVSVHDTHSIGGAYIKTTSLTDTYSTTVVGGNDSQYIYTRNNWVDGVVGPTAPGGSVYPAFYKFTQHIWVTTPPASTRLCAASSGVETTTRNGQATIQQR